MITFWQPGDYQVCITYCFPVVSRYLQAQVFGMNKVYGTLRGFWNCLGEFVNFLPDLRHNHFGIVFVGFNYFIVIEVLHNSEFTGK